MSERIWLPIETMPDKHTALTKIDNQQGVRNVQSLKRDGNMFWFPDGSMYVYYTPTHWSPTP